MQNTEEIIEKYAVDANLFRLGSTNPKKNIQSLDFSIEIFFFYIFSIFEPNFFFRSVQIYIKEAECAETNGKSIFRFFQFFFLSYGNFCPQNISNYRFSTLRSFH